MASCVRLLHFPYITLIIFLALSSSNGDNNLKYTSCSSFRYSCGKIQNVTYPFWGSDRPQFCGIPDYKLNCQENDNTTINIGNNNRSLYLEVHAIDTSSNTMKLSSKKLFDRCESYHPGYISPKFRLKAMAGYRNISLYYNCSSPCDSKSYNCSYSRDTSNPGKVYYFDEQSESKCSCKGNTTFFVDNTRFDELKKPKAQLQSILTELPIQMEYSVDFTNCSKCQESGGTCGSSDDPSSSHFMCYCPHTSHSSQQLTCPPESDSKKKLEVIVGLGVGGVFVVSVAIIIGMWYRKKKSHSRSINRSASIESSASDLEKGGRYFGVPLFSYRELVEATNNFDESNELGDGGFGIVYHGKLKDGREVAVKRLYEKNYRRIEQFMNEIHILTNLRHHNLVSLYGCTSQHCRELLLVYEYVSNGTVADHLFSKSTTSRSSLPWPVRLKIAVETATALSYLHASDIIHRDVKTNNILLDRNFCVKVADFGLSRLFPTDVTHVSTAPQGTPGYLDPEYHQCYQLTDKSDVYSFGVVLIELVSSLPAIDMDRHRHEINLSNYATNRIQRGAFEELVDPQLGFATDFRVRRMTISVAELAFQCLQHDKNFRPSMDEVLEVLKRIEGADYEALLQAEEKAKEAAKKVVNLHSSSLPPPPSPTEDDHQQLLRNHQLHSLHPPSPISVIEHWVSRSTTPSNSK